MCVYTVCCAYESCVLCVCCQWMGVLSVCVCVCVVRRWMLWVGECNIFNTTTNLFLLTSAIALFPVHLSEYTR